MAKRMTNEFMIRYMEDFKDPFSLVESSCKNWNTVAKNQLKRKIENYEDVYEDKLKKTKSFEIGFQNGSKAYFLFVPKNITVFGLHSEIQESFMEGIKEHDNMSFNVMGLSDHHQKILVSALTSAVSLYEWKYPRYGKKSTRKRKEKKEFGFYVTIDGVDELIKSGEAIAEGTNLVRTLASTPTNYMKSRDLADQARKVAHKLRGASFNYIGENKLKELKAGCFLSVIQGTKGSDGGIAHISYRTRAKDSKNIAIVGKGVVFDTGGYDVKTDSSMDGMHRDMTGAAVSLALFQALVKSKVKANIDLYLAIGENLISEAAYKPNDVVIAMDGTSVEVTNTDAEGRMLLADTLIYANQADPDLIIDFATLTGDAVAAIDTRYSCVFSNKYELGLKAVEAGRESGERVWNFPTTDDFVKNLGSDVADISQCSDQDNAEHIYAACFLKHFAGETPWIHVDLSAEICEDGLGMVDTDVTGFGVRWGFEFIQKIVKEG